MLSQNLEGGSNYASEMLIFIMGMKIGIGQRILQALIKIIGQLKLPENEVAQNMLNGSLDQSSLIWLGYANFFSIPEP